MREELILYKRRVNRYSEKHGTANNRNPDINTIIELIDLIPVNLVSSSRIKLTSFIHIENNFDSILNYLDWLDSLCVTVKSRDYFTTQQQTVLTEHREISLEAFLTAQGMIYYPYVILNNIRNKAMKLISEISKVDQASDLRGYYERRISGFTPMVFQPVFAIGELAAMDYE